jgi:hypothetical protein
MVRGVELHCATRKSVCDLQVMGGHDGYDCILGINQMTKITLG